MDKGKVFYYKDRDTSAKLFYKSIEKEKEKYKLVNKLFIVKYKEKDISQFVGYFHKAGNYFNKTKHNLVEYKNINVIQLFNKKQMTTFTNGSWKALSISFIEEPIESILDIGIKCNDLGRKK